jgi:hypothetical protein
MNVPSPEPPEERNAARPDGEPEGIMARLREHATLLDPTHARLYRSMPVDRWLDATGLAADLLVEHWRYLYARPRPGRRAHNAAVYALLGRTNEAQVVAALAWVHMAIWLLPDPTENQ